jgi:hypothetical protein
MDPFEGMGFGLGKWIIDEGFWFLAQLLQAKIWYPHTQWQSSDV